MPRTAPVPNIPAIPGMNPGVFVMGGGGGGGGGSGKGGKGAGGDQGADGENGGDGAEGGGDGAGACGQGANGACTNCGHNIAAGDPVDVSTGRVFTVPKTDLFLPGILDLDLRRSYSSARREIDLGMGFGWVHSFAWRLEERRRNLHLIAGDGRMVKLPIPNDESDIVLGSWGVMKGDGFYAIRPGNEFIHFFGRSELDPRSYVLTAVRYRNRGHVAFQYERGLLARIVDSVGRVILVKNTSEGRIESISVSAPQGETIRFARYAYDNVGNLVAAADADGNVTRYAYDEEHRLTRQEFPHGLTTHYRYDQLSRCVETWGSREGRDPALADDLPEFLVDGRTKVKGIYHCKLEFVDDELTYVTDSERMRSFISNADGVLEQAVDGSGGVTTRTFDPDGRVTTQTDPTSATWSYRYDALGFLSSETDPEGHTIQVERVAGRPVEITDAAGGIVTLARDAFGEVEETTNQVQGRRRFVRDARGLLTDMVDETGGEHRYEWDQHANLVGYTDPRGTVYRFAYDYFGRKIADYDPSGADRRFDWSPSGRLVRHVDRVGRETHLAYDAMGNLVSIVDRDGTATRIEYGGLNWRTAVHRPDGTSVTFRYNYEGWMRYLENGRGERHEYHYDATGHLVRERGFFGQEKRYGHDALGRLAWYETSEGRVDIERSPSGRILKEEHIDGASSTFEYDLRGELISATADDITFRWERDAAGRVVRETFEVESESYTVTSERDRAGRRTRMETSLGHALDLKRDPRGLVTDIHAGSSRVMSLERGPLGVPVRRELSDGGAIVDSYDAELQLRRRRVLPAGYVESAGEPERVGRDPSSYDVLYDYSPVRELIKVTPASGDDVELEYDVRRRLTRRSRGKDIEAFTADPEDNYYEQGPNAPTRAYAPGDQLVQRGNTRYSYDDEGRLVEQVERNDVTGEQTTRYHYDPRGLLTAVDLPDGTRVEYLYDAFARRLAKKVLRGGVMTTCRHYVWDLATLLHEVELGADESSVTYVYLENDHDTPIAQREADSGWTYLVGDVADSPDALVDGTGHVVGRLERDALGRMRPTADSEVTTSFRMPGQIEDAETGLHYNRYRYYDPDGGRYITPDPVGFLGGFNLYRYGPNPISWVDPMGWTTTHFAGVTETTPGGTPPGATPFTPQLGMQGTDIYDSSWTGCPQNMRNRSQTRPQSHSEQKFARDLINQFGGQQATGRSFQLDGMYPPCPNCHGAMMRAAADTGADVEYTWMDGDKPQSITYAGGSGAPTFVGGQAADLRDGGYGDSALHDNHAFNPNAGGTAQSYWGMTPGSGSRSTYDQMMSRGATGGGRRAL